MSFRRRGMDLADDVHAAGDFAEGGEALAVRVTLAAEVEFRLISDTNEEIGCGGVGPIARHGEGTVKMLESGVAGAFERDGREFVFDAARGDARLDDCDFHFILRLIVGGDGAMKQSVIVEAAIHVAEKVRCRPGRVSGVEFEFDVAEFGFEENANGGLAGAENGGRQRKAEQKASGSHH